MGKANLELDSDQWEIDSHQTGVTRMGDERETVSLLSAPSAAPLCVASNLVQREEINAHQWCGYVIV